MDQNLPSSGKDTKIVITVDGALKEVVDQVTNFTAKAIYDEIVTKPMGQSGSLVDKEFVGWEGDIELALNTAEVDEMMDLINAALIARIPLLLVITDTSHFRDGTSKTYTYPDVKLEYDARKKRGEANGITLRWKTGKNRIAA
jgi:hypothetical protein